MTETEFNDLIDDTLSRIEAAIEAAGLDVDTELSAGILTLTFDNGSQIIVNRQTAMRELWVAARSGGYHFRLDESGAWRNTRDGGALAALLSQAVSAQAGTPAAIDV